MALANIDPRKRVDVVLAHMILQLTEAREALQSGDKEKCCRSIGTAFEMAGSLVRSIEILDAAEKQSLLKKLTDGVN